ncbi:MAG: TrkH family potassium uptake protein [Thermotaleaceae bacterium]
MAYIEQIKGRYNLIIGYIGTIMVGVGLALLIPLMLLPAFKSEIYQASSFLIPSALTILIGVVLRRWKNVNYEVTLTLQEGGVIVILAWLGTVLVSALPFMLSGQLNFTQAIFESVSGWTTTGLSVVDVAEMSNIFLLWRSTMQFFGGAGIAVVMLSAIIGPHGLGLYNAEGRSDKLLPNVAKSTKLIMMIYSSYVLAGVLLYIAAGMPWFDAINHAIAALSTGGFSTKVNSIGEYHNLKIELITIILMILGTINFAAHFVLLKGQVKRFLKIGEIRFMFFLLSVAIPIVSFLSLSKIFGSLGKSIRVGAFEIISALSTTGFSTVSYSSWDSFAVFFMIILMIIGGGTGSTAGGLKLYRVYLMIKSLGWNIRGYLLPQNSIQQNYVTRAEGKYYVSQQHIIDVSSFTVLYMITYVFGVAVIVLHGYPLQDAMFEFASSLGTVGLSVGITAPNAPVLVLWTQILGMMLGRLEFLVIFFAGAKMIRDIRLAIKKERAVNTFF